jgi:hypothetical protein
MVWEGSKRHKKVVYACICAYNSTRDGECWSGVSFGAVTTHHDECEAPSERPLITDGNEMKAAIEARWGHAATRSWPRHG